ncbi:MAG: hypothetical protein LBH22_08660 [Bacteroidales bacterium]|jgi:hypothetical protein|nr:hypothetical protein [Bacteroidales bacterium]
MKTKYVLTIIWLFIGTSLFSQATRDTIYIYDTIRISVKRPAPAPTIFFEEPTATIFKDSIIIDEEPKQSSTMRNLRTSANRLIRNIGVGTMAAVSGIVPSMAQPLETIIIKDTVVTQIVEIDSVSTPKQTSPIYLSFAYPAGLFGVNSEDYVFNLAFSALTGAVGGVNGVQFGGIYNQVSGPMRGVQFGGIMNLTEQVEGIQFGGICNFTKDVKGIQFAGIYNHSGDIRGIQTSGIANVAEKVEGIQWSGIYNVADTLIGIQSSGIANEATTIEGMQWAGIYNRADRVRGIQIGLYNETKTLNGVQIGLINKVDSIEKGVSIGLFNFLKHDRFHELEVIQSTYHTTFLSYRLGGRKLHGLMAIGTDIDVAFVSNKTFTMDFRLGVGNNTQLWNNLHLQTSLYRSSSIFSDASPIFSEQFRHRFGSDNWTTLSSGLVYYWGNKIGIKIVPSLNMWRYKRPTPLNSNWKTWTLQNRFGFDMSLDVGLSIKL